MKKIESATNPKIKLAAGLAKRSQREKTGLFVAEGVRLAEMAAASDWDIAYALVTERAADEERVENILAQLEARETPAFLVPERVYAKASGTETPQGILLVVRQKKLLLEELAEFCSRSQSAGGFPPKKVRPAGVKIFGEKPPASRSDNINADAMKMSPCVIVLDRVQDPGNLGTILRTADAAGMDGVILLKGTVDAFSPKVVRAAMGSLFHMPIVMDVEEDAFLEFVASKKLSLCATALDATARPHFAADFCRPSAIVFGNEGRGVSAQILERAEKIFIPMFGDAESLNVAVSSAIVLYEAVRQRHALSD
ncbi:RNA methyltransferase [uncultured Selenomonas sp.]|uniref:TrmH family RNA methyltransferase n=1 Tax=uncultured Selenomonas sp. TaxID=159275 RepID=UPI0025D37819|nr:RNA methyltransferase [uncultured Selenomonas sp.]